MSEDATEPYTCPLCKKVLPRDGRLHSIVNCADHLKEELAIAQRRIEALELIAAQRKVRLKELRGATR